MTEFLSTAKAQRAQRKYSMKLAAARALSSLRLCGELKSAVYARVQYRSVDLLDRLLQIFQGVCRIDLAGVVFGQYLL
jgi:hypothetical protein